MKFLEIGKNALFRFLIEYIREESLFFFIISPLRLDKAIELMPILNIALFFCVSVFFKLFLSAEIPLRSFKRLVFFEKL